MSDGANPQIPGYTVGHGAGGGLLEAVHVATGARRLLRVVDIPRSGLRYGRRLFAADEQRRSLRLQGFLRLLESSLDDARALFVFEHPGGRDAAGVSGGWSKERALDLAGGIAKACERLKETVGEPCGNIALEHLWIDATGQVVLEPPLELVRFCESGGKPFGADAQPAFEKDVEALGRLMENLLDYEPQPVVRQGTAKGSPGETPLRILLKNLVSTAERQGYTHWAQIVADIGLVREGLSIQDVSMLRVAPAPAKEPAGPAAPLKHAAGVVIKTKPRRRAEGGALAAVPRERDDWIRDMLISLGLIALLVIGLIANKKYDLYRKFTDGVAARRHAAAEKRLAEEDRREVDVADRVAAELPPSEEAPLAPEVAPEAVPDAAPEKMPETIEETPASETPPPAEAAAAQEIPPPDPAQLKALREYAQAMRAVLEGHQARDYDGVAKVLADWLGGHPAHPHRADLEKEQTRLDSVQAVYRGLEEASSNLIGVVIRTGAEFEGPVASLGGGFVGINRSVPEGTMRYDMPLRDLDLESLRNLVYRAWGKKADGPYAKLLLSAGRMNDAIALVPLLQGADQEDLILWIGDWRKAWAEIVAAGLWQRIDQMAARGDPAGARRLLLQSAKTLEASVLGAAMLRQYESNKEAWTRALKAAPVPDYPGLPDLGENSLPMESSRQQIERATEAAVGKGLWQEHLRAIDGALGKAVPAATAAMRGPTLTRMTEQPVLRSLMAQAALIRLATPARLARAFPEARHQALALWLLGDIAVLEAFVQSLEPEDRIDVAFEVLRGIWDSDQAGCRAYPNLAIACALVYDDPPNACDPTERFGYFKRAADQHGLQTEMDQLPPSDLIWVVDTGLPLAELEWAQRKVNLPRARWADAYAMVPSSTLKDGAGAKPSGSRTLRDMLEKGGTCDDQAFFAASAAKANGIPAMTISATGRQGAHTWFGYKATAKLWNLEAGRFGGDAYAAGTAVNPQTRKTLKENEIRLMADPQTRGESWARAARLVWLAESLLAVDRPDDAATALELAVEASSRNGRAWELYLNRLQIADPGGDKLRKSLKEYRTVFRQSPERLALADRLELEADLVRGREAGVRGQ
jgi:hypothetical protein